MSPKIDLKLSELTIMLTTLTLFISGFAIYLANKPPNPIIRMENVSFNLGENFRSIELTVRAEARLIEIKQVFVDNNAVYYWQAEKSLIEKGEEAKIILKYPWKMGKSHKIKIVTVDNYEAEFSATAPKENPTVTMNIEDVNFLMSNNHAKIRIKYEAEGEWVDSLQIMLFTYLTFNKTDRNTYVFYDERYMVNESLNKAEAIINMLQSYEISAYKADYETLKTLSAIKSKATLIIINPLKDQLGRKIRDAMPAPIIDPNGNGFIRDNSKYGKSLIYDWMKDSGLILVTVGSVEPYKRILYEDGSYRYAGDSHTLLDAHLFLTDAWGEEPILGGTMVTGDYSPTRITGTLGLHYRESSLAFNKDALEKYGLNHYEYGDYKLNIGGQFLNLTLPAFIRVGKGGWLSLGDEEDWLMPEEIAHDILMLTIQSIWDSNWIPYGWYWDSGTAYHQSSGIINKNGSVETEFMPTNIIGDKIIIRIVGLAYSQDLKTGVKLEYIIEQEIP